MKVSNTRRNAPKQQKIVKETTYNIARAAAPTHITCIRNYIPKERRKPAKEPSLLHEANAAGRTINGAGG